MFCPNCGKENDDSIRHCQSCGSFIPDPSILGVDNTPAMSEAKPLTYQALSEENVAEIKNDASRYQEYTMSDVVARKNHKKLIIWLIVIAAVLALGVAAFFTVRGILRSQTMNRIKDDPTRYVLASYQTTAKSISSSSDLLESLTAQQTQQKTTKVTTTVNGMKQQQITAIDGANKRMYFSQSMEYDKEALKELGIDSMPNQTSLEFYATLDRVVLKAAQDDKTTDYYLDLNNLRQDALTSAFGPKGENLFKLNQENYDMIMDVYEFVYNNLKKDNDPFGLSSLGKKICEDIDQYGNINVANEKADIDGTSVDAVVITHTFRNTDIIVALFNDVKDWVKNNVNINANINQMIDEAFEKINITQQLGQFSSQLDGVELILKHYINKDNALMQTDVILQKDGQSGKLTLCFGAKPADSKKSFLKLATVDKEGHEMTVQTVTLTDDSTDAEEKHTISYVGFVVNGSTTFVRNKATGDFTLSNNMQMAAMGGMLGQQNSNAVTSESKPDYNFTFNGNLKMTPDALTVTYKQPNYDGTDIVVECTVSNQAEIKELTSQNNVLTASAKDLVNFVAGGGLRTSF